MKKSILTIALAVMMLFAFTACEPNSSMTVTTGEGTAVGATLLNNSGYHAGSDELTKGDMVSIRIEYDNGKAVTATGLLTATSIKAGANYGTVLVNATSIPASGSGFEGLALPVEFTGIAVTGIAVELDDTAVTSYAYNATEVSGNNPTTTGITGTITWADGYSEDATIASDFAFSFNGTDDCDQGAYADSTAVDVTLAATWNGTYTTAPSDSYDVTLTGYVAPVAKALKVGLLDVKEDVRYEVNASGIVKPSSAASAPTVYIDDLKDGKYKVVAWTETAATSGTFIEYVDVNSLTVYGDALPGTSTLPLAAKAITGTAVYGTLEAPYSFSGTDYITGLKIEAGTSGKTVVDVEQGASVSTALTSSDIKIMTVMASGADGTDVKASVTAIPGTIPASTPVGNRSITIEYTITSGKLDSVTVPLTVNVTAATGLGD